MSTSSVLLAVEEVGYKIENTYGAAKGGNIVDIVLVGLGCIEKFLDGEEGVK